MSESDSGSYVRVEDYDYLVAKLALFEAGERVRQMEETRRLIHEAAEAELDS